jgi:hypothetical protein
MGADEAPGDLPGREAASTIPPSRRSAPSVRTGTSTRVAGSSAASRNGSLAPAEVVTRVVALGKALPR